MSPTFLAGWLAIGLLALAWEVMALTNRRRGDTFSEIFWAVTRKSPIAYVVALGGAIWIAIHLFG